MIDVSRLSTPELRRIAHEATALLSVRVEAAEIDVATLYKTIADEVKAKTNQPQNSFLGFKRTKGYVSLVKNAPEFESLVQQAKPRVSEALLLRRIYVQALIGWMNQKGIPISVTSCCRLLGYTGHVLDLEFPGYRENNLLPMIIRSMRSTK